MTVLPTPHTATDLTEVNTAPPVVLVTGGARGIGRTIAEAFVADGATVVICGRNEPEVPVGEFVACDVRDPDAVDQLVDGIVERHGRIDVVINNAGGSPEADAATASPRFSESIIRLNLTAPLHVSVAANRRMQAQGKGVIVNIASVSGIRPSPGTAAYGAAKAGLLSLTRSLAVEWAPAVRVVAVVCGLIETEQADLHYGDAEGLAAVSATVPLGRMGQPADVAAACRFLASDAASYITGSELTLHGGGEVPAFLTAARAIRDRQAAGS
jgi:NAD(P)-dependent dehydrogenase (short-subunit alcohol dehydrogenase family)